MEEIAGLSPAERDYLNIRYAEEGSRARAFADQRSTNTNLFLALIVGVLAFDVGLGRTDDRLVGLFILTISGVGAAMSYKYNRRQNIHEDLCGQIGNALSAETRPELRFPDDTRMDKRLSPIWIFNILLNYVSAWYVLYLIAAVIGGAMAWNSFVLHGHLVHPRPAG